MVSDNRSENIVRLLEKIAYNPIITMLIGVFLALVVLLVFNSNILVPTELRIRNVEKIFKYDKNTGFEPIVIINYKSTRNEMIFLNKKNNAKIFLRASAYSNDDYFNIINYLLGAKYEYSPLFEFIGNGLKYKKNKAYIRNGIYYEQYFMYESIDSVEYVDFLVFIVDKTKAKMIIAKQKLQTQNNEFDAVFVSFYESIIFN